MIEFVILETSGYCPLCCSEQTFRSTSDKPIAEAFKPHKFRGTLKCGNCGSIPRQRAFARTLMALRPNWRELTIHESSPDGTGMSRRLRLECPGYVATQFSTDFPFGQTHPQQGWRNENLEEQTFEDEAFDIMVCQDVFEHVFHPGRAALEIARTLKPGGLCLMTVPVVNPWGETARRAELRDGSVRHLLPEQYHGNPVGDRRSLVTIDWSYGIGAYLTAHSGMPFVVHVIDDLSMGIRDPYNVVLTAIKAPLPDLGE